MPFGKANSRSSRRRLHGRVSNVLPTHAEILEVRTLLSAVPFEIESVADAGSTPFETDGVIAALALDLDGDGDSDIVTASSADESINWYENSDGAGRTFAVQVIADGFEPGALSHADMDADGDQDIIAAIASDDAVVWFENRLGDGLDFVRHDVGINIDRPRGLAVADVNGDELPDVLVTSFGDDWAAWYENPGADGGDFTRHEITDEINGAVSIVAADVDDDTDIDVIVAGYYADAIILFENSSGDGSSFRTRSVATDLNGVSSIIAADLDGDTDIDFASASRHDDAIHWHVQNPDGSFTSRLVSDITDGAIQVLAADFDVDGDIDLIAASVGDDAVRWFENTGSAAAFQAHDLASANGLAEIFAADIDADGDLDIVVAAEHASELTLIRSELDQIPPVALLADVSPNPRAVPVTEVAVSFSEAITGLDAADFELWVDDVTAVDLTGAVVQVVDAENFLIDLTAVGQLEGVYTLKLIAQGSGVADLVGNAFDVDASTEWVIDTTLPEPQFDPLALSRNEALESLIVDFGEDVNGVDLEDFRLTLDGVEVSLGTSQIVDLGNGRFQILLSGFPQTEGEFEITLNAAEAGITDLAGNAVTLVASATWAIDLTAPVVTFGAVSPSLRATAVGTISIESSEEITGLDAADFMLRRNGIDVALTGLVISSDSILGYTVDLAPFTMVDGHYEFRFDAESADVVDSAGNAADLSALVTWTKDSIAPQGAFIAIAPNSRNTPLGDATLIFSEPVSGVDASDFTLLHRDVGVDLTLASVQRITASHYVISLGSIANIDGIYTLQLISAGSDIQDAVGTPLNGNAEMTWRMDTTSPLVTIQDVDPNPRSSSVPSIAIQFSEPIKNFTGDDVQLTRDGSANLLIDSRVLTSLGNGLWMVSNLESLTGEVGAYQFSIAGNTSEIMDLAGNALNTGASTAWSVQRLSVEISDSMIEENAGDGATTALIRRLTGDLTEPLTVELAFDIAGQLSAPAEVTIPADSDSVTVSLDAIDNSVLDGTRIVTLSADAIGYAAMSASVMVADHETLSIESDSDRVSEIDGALAATGRVTRGNTDIQQSLEVTLEVSDASEIDVPATVVIPAGEAVATFEITTLDDSEFDGDQFVSVLASAAGYFGSEFEVVVQDLAQLELTIESSVSELAPASTTTATVTRKNRDHSADLVVQLSVDDPGEASVPEFVTILAGDASASFTITSVDDDILDGTQIVNASANAVGFAQVSRPLSVHDFELPQVIDPARKTSSLTPTIRWTAIEGAELYDIQVNDMSRLVKELIRETSVTSNSFLVPNSLPIGEYRVWVQARNTLTKSRWSVGHRFWVSPKPSITGPSKVTTTATPTITWDALPGATSYELEVNNLTTREAGVITVDSIPTNAFTPVESLGNGVYRAWVRALDVKRVPTSWSAGYTFTVDAIHAPDSVLVRKLDGQHSIEWSTVATAATYDIEVRRVTDGQLMLNVEGHASTTLNLATDFSIGQYTSRIRAASSGGTKSEWQSSAVFRVDRPPVGSAPIGATPNATPLISWSIPVGAVRYQLQVNDLTRGVKSMIYVDVTANSFTPIVPLLSGNYRAWVRAFDETGIATSWSVGWNFQVTQLVSEI